MIQLAQSPGFETGHKGMREQPFTPVIASIVSGISATTYSFYLTSAKRKQTCIFIAALRDWEALARECSHTSDMGS